MLMFVNLFNGLRQIVPFYPFTMSHSYVIVHFINAVNAVNAVRAIMLFHICPLQNPFNDLRAY